MRSSPSPRRASCWSATASPRCCTSRGPTSTSPRSAARGQSRRSPRVATARPGTTARSGAAVVTIVTRPSGGARFAARPRTVRPGSGAGRGARRRRRRGRATSPSSASPPGATPATWSTLLDVERDGDLAFVAGAHTDGRRPVVEGSQMLGQAIVAAGRHAPGRRVVSASMMFLRAADAGSPVALRARRAQRRPHLHRPGRGGAPGRPPLRGRHPAARRHRTRDRPPRGGRARRAGPLRLPARSTWA